MKRWWALLVLLLLGALLLLSIEPDTTAKPARSQQTPTTTNWSQNVDVLDAPTSSALTTTEETHERQGPLTGENSLPPTRASTATNEAAASGGGFQMAPDPISVVPQSSSTPLADAEDHHRQDSLSNYVTFAQATQSAPTTRAATNVVPLPSQPEQTNILAPSSSPVRSHNSSTGQVFEDSEVHLTDQSKNHTAPRNHRNLNNLVRRSPSFIHVREQPLLNVTCGSMFHRYDAESLKREEWTQFAVRPVGCVPVLNGLAVYGDDGGMLNVSDCGLGNSSSMLEAARLVAVFKPEKAAELRILNDKCPNDPRVAAKADHLVSCAERHRTRLVLPAPTLEAQLATPGTKVVDDANVPEFVEAFESLPLAQCDAWNYLRCQAANFTNTMNLAEGAQKKNVERLWSLLWGEWNPTLATFCTKSGNTLSPKTPLQHPTVQHTAKGSWVEIPMSRKRFYRLHNVTHFQGQYYHATLESAASVTLEFTPHFHYVRGLWPRDAITSVTINPLTNLTRGIVKKMLPKDTKTPKTHRLHVAYHLPPIDMFFSYHILGDGLMPMIHGLRQRLALGLKTPLIMYRPTRISMTGVAEYPPNHCFYGVDACVAHNPRDGEFGELLEFIAGGLQNIHFVELPVKGKIRPAPGSIAEYEALRMLRGVQYSSTIFEIDELIVGNPSHCAAALSYEGLLVENAEPIRLGKSNLDCGAMMATFRDTVVEMVQLPSLRSHRKRPAPLPTSSTRRYGYSAQPADAEDARIAESRKPKPRQSTLPAFFSQLLCSNGSALQNSTSRAVLPNVTLEPTVSLGDGNVHVMLVVRRSVVGRVIINEEEVTSALHRHLAYVNNHTKRIVAQGRNSSEGTSVRLTIAEVSSMCQAAQLLTSATLLILTHGAAMMYLPLLRAKHGGDCARHVPARGCAVPSAVDPSLVFDSRVCGEKIPQEKSC